VIKQSSEQIDGIRLIWSPGATKQISGFLSQLRDKDGEYLAPVMIDISSQTRGTIQGLKQPKEIAFGEKLCIRRDGKGDFSTSIDDWELFFQSDTSLYFWLR
jgi:hypothetical protein